MKTVYLNLFFALTLLAACKEEPVGINFKPDATTLDSTTVISDVPSPELKVVLIEDISGVKCPNCPEAADIAKSISDANPNRIAIINMQPNTLSLRNFCQPIDDGIYKSKYDLRTQAAADIIKAVTTPGSLPSGYIDRKTFSPNSDPVTPREEWVNDANQELSATTPVNIKVSGKYNFPDSTVTVDLTLIYTSSVSDSNFISVAIIEDDIMDLQEKKNINTGDVDILTDYVHQHVLLDMITASTGDLLNTNASKSLVAGRVFVKRYTASIKPHANAAKLKVVAFVHKGSGAKYYVLQSKEADIK